MNIVVCIKQVPDTKGGVKFNADGTLDRAAMLAIMNPDDKAGLEAALRIKDQNGAKVTVLTMGLPKADAVLREAMAMGADDAILVTDRVLGGADTWATSTTIAGALRNLDYDLIITGRQAIDGDTAQVGPQIAEHLGLPVIVQILVTVIYIIGANLVFKFQLSVGSVFAFITYSAYVTGPISAILNIGYLLSGIIPSTKRYYEFMNLQEETDKGKLIKPEFGNLKLEEVFFSYETDKPILTDVNIEIPKGSKTVLIGKNGSGKSTIINLLTRMYEPTAGQIKLKGVNIFEITLESYRNMISVVSQQIYLFNDTIRNNICIYKKVSDEVIETACKDSGLEDFLKEVSLDYVVGQNGAMLSGGQKQKIALARALVHDKPIIIFDEVTSNTDVYSEHQINGLLHTRLKEKTVIIITHKQEILQDVDQIVMLKDGAVVGTGKYDDLVINNAEFKDMLRGLKKMD